MSKKAKNRVAILAGILFYIFFVRCAVSHMSTLPHEEDALGNVGPWYSDEFLEENPQYKSDMGR